MNNPVFVENNVLINTKPLKNKEDLFKLISIQAKELKYVLSEEDCYKGLLDREKQQTTGFQDGFAIPHCKSKTVISPKILFVKTLPIPWSDSLDGKDITNSFVLLIPEEGAEEHLKILAKIARTLIDVNFRNALKKANEKKEIFELISNKLEV